ncbi:hypothetical protein M433DRAFT_328846 [Acidomyces richmondensis BFW]|nr:MAG: hypothetical protein FE78DRAFT_466563 [Acidomyces sp. 'richmondensis']KYG43898.1 hypothetical protein M433DRAFT_328846 [Acidomyces richmondensis BFW]
MHSIYFEAFKIDNVLTGFRGSGLDPFMPEAVLSILDPAPFSPASISHSLTGSWQTETLSNAK